MIGRPRGVSKSPDLTAAGVDATASIGDVAAHSVDHSGRRFMTRGTSFAILLGLAAGLMAAAGPAAHAQSATETAVAAASSAHGLTVEEFSAQSRKVLRRAPSRVRIYRGSSYPGPNSERVCNAHYEQEYRPSGTVIVPRMNCYWRG